MLGLEHGQRTQRGEVGPALCRVSAQHAGVGVASDRLADRRPLRVQRRPVHTTSSRGVEVGKRPEKTVEGGPCPGPGQPGRTVVRGIAHQHLGQLSGAFVVCDAAQDVPAQKEQLDQEGPFGQHRRGVP